jgi:DNA recombination-dependent growth factor C
VQITISDEERILLAKVLEQYHEALREEIHRTEGRDFKEKLKGEERAIEGLLRRMK